MRASETIEIRSPGRPALGTVTAEALGLEPTAEILIGTLLSVRTLDGDCVFRVNVSYEPSRPKRQRIPLILEPLRLYDEIWEYEGYSLL